MQKYWIIAICTSVTTMLDCSQTYSINQNTRHIYHRFYMINRLKKTVDFLIKSQKIIDSHLCYKAIGSTTWRHEEIQQVVQEIEQQEQLTPLFRFWERLCSYRYMYDELLETEFACVILLICQQIKVEETECSRSLLQETVNTDHIAHNFYIINRLKKPIEKLYEVYRQSTHFFEQDPKKKGEFFFDEFKEYKHSRISDCVKEIQETQSFKPIKRIYKECAQYRYAGDDSFLREQLCLIFFAYKVMLNKKLSNQSEQVIMHEMDTIQYITQNLDEFSTDQILTAIDMMTDKLSTIHDLEKRGKNGASGKLYLVSIPIIVTGSIYVLYNYLK